MEMSEALKLLHDYLKRTNRRFSVERERLIEAIYEMPESFSLQDLLTFIRAHKNVHALSTIYRNLSLLIDSGIITEFRNPAGRPSYRRGNHALLLVCANCGRALEVKLSGGVHESERRAAEEHGFHALITHRVIRGLCEDCHGLAAK